MLMWISAGGLKCLHRAKTLNCGVYLLTFKHIVFISWRDSSLDNFKFFLVIFVDHRPMNEGKTAEHVVEWYPHESYPVGTLGTLMPPPTCSLCLVLPVPRKMHTCLGACIVSSPQTARRINAGHEYPKGFSPIQVSEQNAASLRRHRFSPDGGGGDDDDYGGGGTQPMM